MGNIKKIIMGLLMLAITLIIIGCSNKETVNIKNINYSVVNKNDLSFGGTKRLSWDIVVEDEVSVSELEALSKEIIKEAKKEENFSAITIGFYDYKEFVGRGYTLGKTEYAPDGDWSKANTTRAGDYRNMDYHFDLKEKDWGLRLTKNEVDVFYAWISLFDEESQDIALPDEDEATREIAQKFGIIEDEVNDILIKQITWTSDNNR